jgi:hypothetical protein
VILRVRGSWPWFGHDSYGPAMPGSIRQRGPNSWQLRVYAGIDASSGRQRWATRTVRGSEAEAKRELEVFLAEADHSRLHAGSVADLLDRWFATASAGWAPSTVREKRSLVGHHLKPHLGHFVVAKLASSISVHEVTEIM